MRFPLLILLLLTSPALAKHIETHTHFYDLWCCNTTDCRAVPASILVWTPEGMLLTDTGELLPHIKNGFPNPAIKWSEDRQNHICRPQSRSLTPAATRCVYRAPIEG